MRRSSKLWATVGVAAAVLVAARIALPFAIENYVNEKLQNMEEYEGSIEDVDLQLWRGAYRIGGITVDKVDSGDPASFFTSEALEFSVSWDHLLRGKLVAEGEFIRPNLNLVQGETDKDSELGKDENWAAGLSELFPFRINELHVRDGRVTFKAPGVEAKDALQVDQVQGQLTNLTNVQESDKETFAEFSLAGRVLEDAPIRVAGELNPLADSPTFDLNLELEQVQLPSINPWLQKFLNADAEAGTFQLYLEVAAADGSFEGYAKPLMQNVDIYSGKEDEGGLLKRLWEGVVDLAADIVENDEADQVGARVPLSGSIENPETSILQTIVSVLRNAFVGAFARSLEGSVSLRDAEEKAESSGKEEE